MINFIILEIQNPATVLGSDPYVSKEAKPTCFAHSHKLRSDQRHKELKNLGRVQ